MRGYKPLFLLLALLVFTMVGPTPAVAEEYRGDRILFDYSHGQQSTTSVEDMELEERLVSTGYEVDCIFDSMNDTDLSGASVLVIGSLSSPGNGITEADISFISDWFFTGNKVLWLGCDSDYTSNTLGQWVNDNMTALLKAIGAHVYPEPTQVIDPESNCGQEHMAIANLTGEDPLVRAATENVTAVLMHSGTLLYGLQQPEMRQVPLGKIRIPDVFPILYYSPAAMIYDYDRSLKPVAHSVGDNGHFVACALEIIESSIVIVSGASPYGSQQSMSLNKYAKTDLDGMRFVCQTIDQGMEIARTIDSVLLSNFPSTFPHTLEAFSGWLDQWYPLLLLCLVLPLIAINMKEKRHG